MWPFLDVHHGIVPELMPFYSIPYYARVNCSGTITRLMVPQAFTAMTFSMIIGAVRTMAAEGQTHELRD
jgi:hypothetical protein